METLIFFNHKLNEVKAKTSEYYINNIKDGAALIDISIVTDRKLNIQEYDKTILMQRIYEVKRTAKDVRQENGHGYQDITLRLYGELEKMSLKQKFPEISKMKSNFRT